MRACLFAARLARVYLIPRLRHRREKLLLGLLQLPFTFCSMSQLILHVSATLERLTCLSMFQLFLLHLLLNVPVTPSFSTISLPVIPPKFKTTLYLSLKKEISPHLRIGCVSTFRLSVLCPCYILVFALLMHTLVTFVHLCYSSTPLSVIGVSAFFCPSHSYFCSFSKSSTHFPTSPCPKPQTPWLEF